MRKRRTLLVCLIGAVLMLIALLAYNPNSREPSYDGHPLSYWVAQLGYPAIVPGIEFGPAKYDEATNAINHIGPAALPFLVKWIQYEPPPWRFRVGGLLYRIPLRMGERLSYWVAYPAAYQLAIGTSYAFDGLGKRIMPAFGDLCRLMNDTNRPYTANNAADALGYLGTNALPPLLAVLTNANHPARVGALTAFRRMPDLGDAAQVVVPVIMNCLNPTNIEAVQVNAIVALGNLKASPQISLPALISCLKSTNTRVRYFAAASLAEFGPKASSAIPVLTNALTDSDPHVRASAADALHQIAPATFTNAPSR